MSSLSLQVEDPHCVCPRCGSRLRRLARRGLLQSQIYPLFGYYPWECLTCRGKRIVRNRGRRAFQSMWDSSYLEAEPAVEAAQAGPPMPEQTPEAAPVHPLDIQDPSESESLEAKTSLEPSHVSQFE